MARHFLDLDGAQTVPTEAFKLTRRAISDLFETRAMGVVHGEAGLGKTFAVEEALNRWPDVESLWAAFPSRPTMRLVAVTLLELLTRVPCGERNRFYATALLVEELAQRPRMLVIDEAQRLNRECIEYLRHLHDQPTTHFALLLVGGDGTWEVLSREPMLRSRVYRRVTFQPLPAPHMIQAIRSYHLIYQDTTDELLLFIDDNFGHGNFRNWASFTRSAQDICRHAGRLQIDERVARNVFTLYGGGVNAC
jgi:DNA transposition AAA+ family ATPase